MALASVFPGPGKVLAELNRRIENEMHAVPVFDKDSLDKALAAARE